MMTGWVKRAGFAFLLTGVLGFTASPVRGQDRETECRCVDRDGSEIENCICVRTPRMDRLVRGALMTGAARPRLGITVEVSESTSTRGARISGVMEEGPAEQAGLAEGDVITSVDGQPLSQPLAAELERDLDPVESLPAQRLLALVRQLEPGDRVEIEYLRDGESRRATVEAEDLGGWGRTFAFEAPGWDAEALGERMRSLSEQMRHLRAPRAPDAPRAPAPRAFRFELDRPEAPGAWFGFGPTAAFGLEMAPLTPDLGRYFGADRGVLVTAVEEGNALGLRAGDVILEVDGRAVEDPRRVRAILATYDEDEPVVFRVRRDGSELDLSGRIGG